MTDVDGLETGRITIVRWIDDTGRTRFTLDRRGDAREMAAAVAMLALSQDRVLHPADERNSYE